MDLVHLIDSTELVRVGVPTDARRRGDLIRRLDTLARIDHPSLVRVVTISPVGGDRMDVRLDRPDAADLPAVLASRGAFSAAEASGMVTAVAQALAALHSEGLAHGHLEATDVLFTPDGAALLRPRLAPPPEAAADPADDLPSLARLAQSVLHSGPIDPPGRHTSLSEENLALRGELVKACADDPAVRPQAGTFAALVHDAVPPRNVDLPSPETLAAAARTGPVPVIGPAAGGRVLRRVDLLPEPEPAEQADLFRWHRRIPWHRLRERRPAVLAALAASGLVFGVGAGALATASSAFSGDEAQAETSAQADPVTLREIHRAEDLGADMAAIGNRGNPASAAAELTRLRMLLLSGMPVEVSDIDLSGSPAYDADVALLERMDSWGVRVSGAEVRVAAAEVVGAGGPGGSGGSPASRDVASANGLDSVVVRVEYTISAHMQIDAGGASEVPASEPRAAMLAMTWTDDGWRVHRAS